MKLAAAPRRDPNSIAAIECCSRRTAGPPSRVEPDNPILKARIDEVARLRAERRPTLPTTVAAEPVPMPLAAHRKARGETGNGVELLAIRHAAMILAPRHLGGVSVKVTTADPMMDADLGTANARRNNFRPDWCRRRPC